MKLRIIYGTIFLIALWMGITFLRRIMGGMDNRRTQNDAAHYEMMSNMYKGAPRERGHIVFLGDDTTEALNFQKLLPSMFILNRGIASDTTEGVLNRLGEVVSLTPSKLFILIGANDIANGLSTQATADNIKKIVEQVKEDTPKTRIYLQGLLPSRTRERPDAKVRDLNHKLQFVAMEAECTYIDLFPAFTSGSRLNWDYSLDGLHLTDAGVAKWLEYLKPYLEEEITDDEEELY